MTWTIGELARLTGVTVRTLHHYDERGLLAPSGRTEAGYRVYGEPDLRRLLRIVSLRGLGFALGEIGALLDDPAHDAREALRAQLARVEADLAARAGLRDRLVTVLTALERTPEPGTELTIDAIEVMTTVDRYYSADDRARLAELHADTTQEEIEQTQRDWAELFAEAGELRAAGVAPSDPRAAALVDRSDELVARFTKGDAQVSGALGRLWQGEGPAKASHGMVDAELFGYLQEARAARSGG